MAFCVEPIFSAKFGPIFEKKVLKPSAISLGLVNIISFTFNSFTLVG
jgi:hypothetical protein